MGCDIYLYIEKYVDDQWWSLDTWVSELNDFTGWEYDGEDYPGDNNIPDHVPRQYAFYIPYKKRRYVLRNYDLFSFLADVRNENDIEVLQMPRGLPDDCCDEIKQAAKYAHAHGHTYYRLEELLNVDWNMQKETIRTSGFLEMLKKLEGYGDTKDIRLVMWFQ